MARRTIKAKNLRCGDNVLYFGKVDQMNQLWYNPTLQERCWDVYMTQPDGKTIHEYVHDNDNVLIER